jgi:hypothetical protein
VRPQASNFPNPDITLNLYQLSARPFGLLYSSSYAIILVAVLQVENVRLLDRFNTRKPAVGTLYLTATHLIFVDPAGKKETWVSLILNQIVL